MTWQQARKSQSERGIVKLTREEGRKVVYDAMDDWVKVKGTKHIIGQKRGETRFEVVLLHKLTGKHYSLRWLTGSAECQESTVIEYVERELPEVELREVTEKKWVLV